MQTCSFFRKPQTVHKSAISTPSFRVTLLPRMRERVFPAAFTMVELLVVVAILGILAALLLPLASRMTAKAREAKCVSNLRQLGIGILSYAGEKNNGRPPAYPDFVSTGIPNAHTMPKLAWPYLIADYVGYNETNCSPAIFACPSGVVYKRSPVGNQRGYAMNKYACDTLGKGTLALLVEVWNPNSGDGQTNVMYSPAFGAQWNYTYFDYVNSTLGNTNLLAWRHNGGMNVLRNDGSIFRSLPGTSGYGNDILWMVDDNGRKWIDGQWRTDGAP